MADTKESESMDVAESARQIHWDKSFLKEMFMGSFNFNLINPFPKPNVSDSFRKFYDKLEDLIKNTDSCSIDTTGEYPDALISGLRKLKAFGMKIDKKYGGLGLNQYEYDRVMRMLGRYDGNVVALLSAHQSIGVPQPLKVFGTEQQKQKFLPRIANGAISAFALTEKNVGSDPARMDTVVETLPNGDYKLNGTKLWCTNGTLAELIVVMAKHANEKKTKISAFVLDMSSAGVKVEHRCRFMGLKALSNAVINFKDVIIPKDNLIGEEGMGLKIALTTLNAGRLAVPAGCVGCVDKCLDIISKWTNERVQWGHQIGKHEAISHKVSDIISNGYAMQAVSVLSSRLACIEGYDIRLEAAAAKEFNTYWGWQIIDETMQIRGGRGYETESSLKSRGEHAEPIERMMRDFRINRIFEGSSEIMHLIIAREALDDHMKMAKPFMSKSSTIDKIKAGFKMSMFYPVWLSKLMLPTFGMKYWKYGKLAKHLKFIDKMSKKLARTTFIGMMMFGKKMQYKQAFMFRIVDIILDLFAMSASISYAISQNDNVNADMFCRLATRRINDNFSGILTDAMSYDKMKHKHATRYLYEKNV